MTRIQYRLEIMVKKEYSQSACLIHLTNSLSHFWLKCKVENHKSYYKTVSQDALLVVINMNGNLGLVGKQYSAMLRSCMMYMYTERKKKRRVEFFPSYFNHFLRCLL